MTSRLRAKHAAAETVEQYDGTRIAVTLCSCLPYYINSGYRYSIDCPIDRHQANGFRERWEFDDHGNIYAVASDDYDDITIGRTKT